MVTIGKKAVWTDGRYFKEAENSLDCGWILMRKRRLSNSIYTTMTKHNPTVKL